MVWCICVPDSLELLSKSVQKLCKCGPQTWADRYLQLSAPGHRQSPIDIRTDEVQIDPKLARKPLRWKYPKETVELVNTGYCWKAHVHGEGSVLEGGPLNHQYELEQYHCHWGENNNVGAEHLVNGQSYAAEIHFVNWNKRYGSFNEALKHGDGLAVLGVFLKVGKENPELNKLCKLTPGIKYKDQASSFKDVLDPSKLLPARGAYYTYLGSLTTPPCNECVIWIVFRDPIEVSPQQLEAFRQMSSLEKDCCISRHDGQILNNYRPPLPKEDRVVKVGFL